MPTVPAPTMGSSRHLQDAAHERKPELLDAEGSRLDLRRRLFVRAAERHLPRAEPCRRRDPPLGLGGAGGVEIDGERVLGAGRRVADQHLARQVARGRRLEPGHSGPPEHVLHVDGFSGAKEGSREDRVPDEGRLLPPGRRQLEAPGLDSSVPGRMDEAEIAILAGRHQEPAVVIAPLPRRRLAASEPALVRKAVESCDAARVGRSFPEGRSMAVDDAHGCAGYRGGGCERRDPDEGRIASPGQVDGEVGDERSGRNEHGLLGIEEPLAEDPALDLDQVEARPRERDADHLGVAPGGSRREGDCQLSHVRRVGVEERLRVGRRLDAAEPPEKFGAPWLGDPDGARGEGLRCCGAEEPRRHVGLEGAKRHGQDGLCVQLDDAEARRELRQRRVARRLQHTIGGRRRRQRAARVVAKIAGDLDAVARVGKERPAEADALDERVVVFGIVPFGDHAQRRFSRPIEHQRDPAGGAPRNRRRECEANRRDRDAVGLRPLARALDPRAERRPDAEAEGLGLGRRDTARGRDAGAPLERYLGVGREALARLDREPGGLPLVGSECRQQPGALGPRDQVGADGVVLAGNREDDAPGHRRLVGRCVESQQEDLIVGDRCPVPGVALEDRRTAGREREAPRSGERAPGEGRDARRELEAAAEARRERLREIVDPALRVDPPGASRGRTLDLERRRCAPGISERDHRLREARSHLHDLLRDAGRREGDDAGRLGRTRR